jgi:phosphoribosylanthranilate isomerase
MVKVKICGITNLSDAEAAVDFGADALGFVFFKGSPRYVPPKEAAEIIRKIPSLIQTIGVVVNECSGDIERIVAESGVDAVQLHGEESPEVCTSSRRMIKAIRVKSLDSLAPLEKFRGLVTAFLLDTYAPDALGGTGRLFNWDIAVEAKRFGKIILAGGLTPENVADAVRYVMPFAVDVSSGVEAAKGKKDHDKMRLFIERAKFGLAPASSNFQSRPGSPS